MKDSLTVLGCRGSVPRSGTEYERYGGATSCYALRLAGQLILIDAGTGILRMDEQLLPGERDAVLLLTHAHADHVLGLAMCRPAFDADFTFRVFGKTRGGLDIRTQLNEFYHAPVWPVGIDGLSARFVFQELTEDFLLEREGASPVRVRSMDAVHPGGCSLLRFDCGGKSVVIATDCSVGREQIADFSAFAKDADLLLIDGQYADEDSSAKQGFGHNSRSEAAALGAACGAKKTLIVHHDPFATDEMLAGASSRLFALSYGRAHFAYEGEVIEL